MNMLAKCIFLPFNSNWNLSFFVFKHVKLLYRIKIKTLYKCVVSISKAFLIEKI